MPARLSERTILMSRPEITTTSVEYAYKEYVRLSDRCASYVQSAFDDIKLLSVSGLTLVWAPLVEHLKPGGQDNSPVLFYGFLTILLAVTFLGLYSLVKQSLVIYYLRHLRPYETKMRGDLGETNEGIFAWTESYSEWRKKIVTNMFLHIQFVVFLAIVVFPIVILANADRTFSYAAIYLVVSASLSFIFLHAARVLLREQG